MSNIPVAKKVLFMVSFTQSYVFQRRSAPWMGVKPDQVQVSEITKRSDTTWAADSIPCPSNSETRSFVKKRLSRLKVKDGKTRL